MIRPIQKQIEFLDRFDIIVEMRLSGAMKYNVIWKITDRTVDTWKLQQGAWP